MATYAYLALRSMIMSIIRVRILEAIATNKIDLLPFVALYKMI